MRQWLPAIALLLAGCASAGNSPLPPPPGTAQAGFVGPDTIQVTVSDYAPAQSVTLAGPQGEVGAASIDTVRSSYPAAPSGASVGIGVGGGGGSGFGGIGLGFPLIGGAPAAPGPIISTATIRLPAEPPYASVWHDSQIRIQVGLPPNLKTITIPAPAPPAA